MMVAWGPLSSAKRKLLHALVIFALCSVMHCRDIPNKTDLHKSCTEENLLVTIRNSCRFRRNHHTVLDWSPKQKLSPAVLNQEKTDMEDLLEILSNGMELVEEWKQGKDRQKREIWRVDDHFGDGDDILALAHREDGQDDIEMERGPISSSSWVSEDERVQLWNRLMTDATKRGDKMRRQSYALVYHCCISGCTESDFRMYC